MFYLLNIVVETVTMLKLPVLQRFTFEMCLPDCFLDAWIKLASTYKPF